MASPSDCKCPHIAMMKKGLTCFDCGRVFDGVLAWRIFRGDPLLDPTVVCPNCKEAFAEDGLCGACEEELYP